MVKLIGEYVDFSLVEAETFSDETHKKTYRIRGPFLTAEIKNRNNRIYPYSILEREVKRYALDKIISNRAVGELDHSNVPGITLDRVSHIIEELTMVGNDGMGVARVLDTACGRMVKVFIDENFKFGVSTKGVGSITETARGNIVNEDFKLLGVDIVSDPSAPSAYVEGILENKDFIIEGDMIMEIAIDTMKKKLDKEGSKNITFALDHFFKSINFGVRG